MEVRAAVGAIESHFTGVGKKETLEIVTVDSVRFDILTVLKFPS